MVLTCNFLFSDLQSFLCIFLSVLKSDNANGLFGLQQPCSPARVENEGEFVTCNVTRQKGNIGTVTVTWLLLQLTSNGSRTAADDFVNFTGSLVFAPGERFKVCVTFRYLHWESME